MGTRNYTSALMKSLVGCNSAKAMNETINDLTKAGVAVRNNLYDCVIPIDTGVP